MAIGQPTRTRVVSILHAIVAFALIPSSTAAVYPYFHNTYSGDISKISFPEHEGVATIAIGLDMDYVITPPEQQFLYVNRIETLGVRRAPNIGTSGEIIALSTLSDESFWTLDLDGMPHDMIVLKDGKLVFVPYYDAWWIAVIVVGKRKVVKKISASHGSYRTRLSPDGERLYVGTMTHSTLSIVDTEKLKLVAQIPFQQGVRTFIFPADDSIAYVQQTRPHGFGVVDLITRAPLIRVNLPAIPEDVEHTPDQKPLFVNTSIADLIAFATHPELDLEKTIPVVREPNAVKFRKDGQFTSVINRRSNEILVT